ncbi:MAG: DUF134 domain-containing protein [Candidatus Odinarchaeia archaeon]
MGMGWRGGRGPGRPRKKRRLMQGYPHRRFFCSPDSDVDLKVNIYFDELEAMRLVDLEGLTQDEAGKKMNISRGTVWRLLESGRRKVVDALVNGKPIVLEPREKE